MNLRFTKIYKWPIAQILAIYSIQMGHDGEFAGKVKAMIRLVEVLATHGLPRLRTLKWLNPCKNLGGEFFWPGTLFTTIV